MTTSPPSTVALPGADDDADDGPERSDTALVRAARLGDEAAFAQIVERHGPAMYRYALRLVNADATDAAEAVQEAFVSAWRGLDGFEGRSSLRTWLIRLVHRRAADLRRKRRPIPVDDDLLSVVSRPASDNPLQSALDAELLEALQQALDELPWHQRAAWLLREVEGMSYDEIAEALSLPVGSVRGHLHRGRRTLAERMARWR
ncbi:RNA polymerase sigma factor [Nocardioides litoris]|uniref:RNA polymerase sigma factor n=1 Tax=Nocardioides litoris TaxID=1926648 RepID=UPI001FE6813E|nr:sigma-70 family RNA polymerase sigma factor [Nocardioides litoris]